MIQQRCSVDLIGELLRGLWWVAEGWSDAVGRLCQMSVALLRRLWLVALLLRLWLFALLRRLWLVALLLRLWLFALLRRCVWVALIFPLLS